MKVYCLINYWDGLQEYNKIEIFHINNTYLGDKNETFQRKRS